MSAPHDLDRSTRPPVRAVTRRNIEAAFGITWPTGRRIYREAGGIEYRPSDRVVVLDADVLWAAITARREQQLEPDARAELARRLGAA